MRRMGPGEMPIGDIEALIASTTYANNSPLPTVGDRTIAIVVNDGDVNSNTATSTITIDREVETAIWSITGDTSINEGASASYLVSLAGNLKSGEIVTVDLGLSDIDTTSSDYASFSTAVQNAVTSYNAGANPGSLTWDGTTLTYTSDGTGPMNNLVISLGTTDDTLIEGPEDFNIALTNALSSTGVSVATDPTSDDVTTTILDTDPTGVTPDAAEWSLTGDASVNEGANATYTISLSGTLQNNEIVTVDLGLSDIDTTSADYASFSTGGSECGDESYNVGANPGSLTWDGTTLTYTSDGTGPMTDLVISLGTTR